MKNLIFVLLTLFLIGCSKDDDMGVRYIFLSVNKTIALANGDQVIIEAVVKDGDFNTLEGIELEYYANEEQLQSNIFTPVQRGDFTLSARFRNIESDKIDIRVVTLKGDIETLELVYDGYRLLTTNDWSISGTFEFAGKIDDLSFPIPPTDITLLLDGEAVDQKGQFQFSEAGTYEFQAKFGKLESNKVPINVRKEKVYDEVVLPIVFHAYGVNIEPTQINRFIDTLNRSFSASAFSQQVVANDLVNPNAVNCYIRFELVQTPPPGRKLARTGLNIVKTINDEYPILTEKAYYDLEAENNWDPNEYINIWIAEGYDFDFPAINTTATFGSGGARGLVYSPFIEADTLLAGLSTLGNNPKDPDPATLSHAILLRSGSVFGSHPDFIVNRVGYYLGLFDTPTFECRNEGDFCEDTFMADFTAPAGPVNEPATCEGFFFNPNNHMSFNRNYSNFTYDQRERMRFVLKHGLYRPRR